MRLFNNPFQSQSKRYKKLIEQEKRKKELFEQAYLRQKEDFEKLTGITSDIIKLLVKDTDENNSDCISAENIISLINERFQDAR